MTASTVRLGLLLAALAGLGATAAIGAPPAAAKPALTNEDVVRLVMTRTPEKDILAAIDSRTVDFELSADMVEELRQAGVNATIIEAMRRRQAAMPKSTAPPAPSTTPTPGRTGTLRLEFMEETGEKAPPSARSAIALKSLPKGMSRRGGVEVGLMSDMALAVLCITSDHVPDHWDTRSPLQGAPRHELLLFRPQSATEKVKGHEVLYLDHLPSYEVVLPEGTHNIVVAAAGKQAGSGTWRLLESDGAKVGILPGRTTRVALRARSQVKGSYMVGFTVDSEWKIAAVEVLEKDAGGAAPSTAMDGEARP
jgi:hypothetical protein